MLFGRRLPLPAPRTLPWPLKQLASAETSLSYDEFGRMVLDIRHDLLKGLTPAMVAWWFRNIGGDMEVEGKRVGRYMVWHPEDHIRWELAGPAPTAARALAPSSASWRRSGATRGSTST